LLADEVRVLAWLDRYGVDARTAAAAAGLWGASAIQQIEADRYALTLLERGIRLMVGRCDWGCSRAMSVVS
jgi:hypothetical protein